MPFNPHEFFVVGEKIKDDTNYSQEARFRTATNRIYYSVFLSCREKLDSLGINTNPGLSRSEELKKMGPHGLVIFETKNKNLLVGERLAALFKHRKRCDYYLHHHTPLQRWQIVNFEKLAKYIFSNLNAVR